MLCYYYGSVSDQFGPSAFNKFDLIWLSLTMQSFILLAIVASEMCEITRNSEIIRTYLKVIQVLDLDANRKRTMQLPISH